MRQVPEQLGRKAPRRTRRSTREPGLVRPHDGARPAVATTVAPNRAAPKLRRAFLPLEAAREASLRDRNRAAFADDPRRVELERRLLDMGGTLALLFLPDPQIDELLERGRYFPGAGALMRLGLPSACHANAAMMFVQSRGAVRIAFGYALSADGLWRQHSWGVDAQDGRVLETTERRVRYYGLVLNDAEAALRLLGLMRSGDLGPEEVGAVRRSLEKIYGPIPAALLD
jgi:hypothetical protein